MSLRPRMVLVATAVVAAFVTLAGVLIVLGVRGQLVEAADEVGEARAKQLANAAADGMLPRTLVEADDLEVAVQVVRDGHVVSGTENALHARVFPVPQQAPGSDARVSVDHLPIHETGAFRVTAWGTRTPQGPATVFVVVDVEDISEFVPELVRQEAIGLALLVVAVAVVLWVVVGRTVGSLEAIRRRAELITGQRLDQRVPEPLAKDEIHRLARTLNAMLARLEDSAIRQAQFVADAAHELRTPLATLQARLETAVVRGEDEYDEALLLDLLLEAQRLSSLVDHLLLLARSDSGTMLAAARPVDLDDVLRDAVSFVQPDRRSVRVSSEPVQVVGDRALLEEVVRNLVDNAVRHARSNVEVSLTSDGGSALLCVDDDGPGIPVARRAEVFRRFVRLDGSRDRNRGGVGLGLAIVAEIVRLHRGSVEISDSPLGGARLCVRLPLDSAASPGSPSVGSGSFPGSRGDLVPRGGAGSAGSGGAGLSGAGRRG